MNDNSSGSDRTGPVAPQPLWLEVGSPLGSESSPFLLDARAVVSNTTFILASARSGKSSLIFVLCEELCAHGIPFVLVDLEGEYKGLRTDNNDVSWACNDLDADYFLTTDSAGPLAEATAKLGARVILDVSRYKQHAQVELVKGFFDQLWTTRLAEGLKSLKPLIVVFDEAHHIVPSEQSVNEDIKDAISRGGKHGVGLLLATQAPSSIKTSVFGSCKNKFIGKLTSVELTDLNRLKLVSPDEYNQLTRIVPCFQTGQFYVHLDTQQPCTFKARERRGPPSGGTPAIVQTSGTRSQIRAVATTVEIAASQPSDVLPLGVAKSSPLSQGPRKSHVPTAPKAIRVTAGLQLSEDMYGLGKEIVDTAQTRLIVFQRTPSLLFEPSRIADATSTQPNPRDVALTASLQQRAQDAAHGKPLRFTYLFSIDDTVRKLSDPRLVTVVDEEFDRWKSLEEDSIRSARPGAGFRLDGLAWPSSGPLAANESKCALWLGQVEMEGTRRVFTLTIEGADLAYILTQQLGNLLASGLSPGELKSRILQSRASP